MPVKLMMALGALIGLAGGGCATMFTGNSQQLTVSSQPPGARVLLNGGYSGVTPVALLLKTEHDYSVTLQREGYQDTTAPVFREFNPVAALNLFSPVCWVVDLATGALWRLTPLALYVTMQPSSGGAPGAYSPPAGSGWGPPPQVPIPSYPPGAQPSVGAAPLAPGAPPPAGSTAPPPPPPPPYSPPPAYPAPPAAAPR
jgi:hypothetical protein